MEIELADAVAALQDELPAAVAQATGAGARAVEFAVGRSSWSSRSS
ncbi:hypothetical protein ACIRL2_28560 [Embleya sp. NPDC127516]